MVNHLAHKLFPDNKLTGVYADGITTQGLPTEYTEGIYTTHNFEHNMDFICNAVNCFPEYQSLVGDDWNDQTYGYALASQANRLISGSTALGLKCNSVYGSTSLYTVPAELSLCVTIQMTQEEYDQLNDSVCILGSPNGTSWFALFKRTSTYLPGFWWYYKNANLPEESGYEFKVGYYSSVMSTILDGKPHKLVCCIGNRTKDGTAVENYSDKGLKFFLDGVAVSDNIGGRNKQFLNTPTEFNATNSFRFGTASTYTLNKGIISNVKYFNFDISASGAAYTLEDYQNDRDVPNLSYLLSPNNITSVPSMPYQAWDCWGFADVPTVSGNSITYTKTGTDVAGFYYSVLHFGWDNTSANFRWRGKRLHFEFDNVSYNFANGIRDITEVWLKIQYTNSGGTGQILLLKQAYSGGFLSFNAEIPADCVYVNAINIQTSFNFNNTITLTTGDTITYTNPRCWVEDFENVSIPTTVLQTISNGKVLELQNKLSGNTWQDESGNGYDMALQGDFEIMKINTISIEDYLNSLKQDSNIGNILVNNNLSYDFEISQYKQQPLESLAIIFTAIALDNIAQES